MTVNRITRLALLTAVTLIIHLVESLIPLPIAIPGVKLGLSNIVILYLLFAQASSDNAKRVPASDAIVVLACRIILSAIITGRLTVIFYSASGGMLAISAMIVLRCFITEKQIWACGVISAVFHNIGQIAAACIITGTPAIAVYLPVLIIAGIFTGAATGFTAQALVQKRIGGLN